MKNFWISKIDKALRLLGFDQDLLEFFDDKEKEAIIIEEYLNLLTTDSDCAAFSVEEMAAFIIDKRTNSII